MYQILIQNTIGISIYNLYIRSKKFWKALCAEYFIAFPYSWCQFILSTYATMFEFRGIITCSRAEATSAEVGI